MADVLGCAIDDAREIVGVSGAAVDLSAVRGLLAELEAALSRSDLLPELDELLG